jgi:hypothetical protein
MVEWYIAAIPMAMRDGLTDGAAQSARAIIWLLKCQCTCCKTLADNPTGSSEFSTSGGHRNGVLITFFGSRTISSSSHAGTVAMISKM